jgi:hypothetical protein
MAAVSRWSNRSSWKAPPSSNSRIFEAVVGKEGESGVADLRANAVLALMARADIVGRYPGAMDQPSAEHLLGLCDKGVIVPGQYPDCHR